MTLFHHWFLQQPRIIRDNRFPILEGAVDGGLLPLLSALLSMSMLTIADESEAVPPAAEADLGSVIFLCLSPVVGKSDCGGSVAGVLAQPNMSRSIVISCFLRMGTNTVIESNIQTNCSIANTKQNFRKTRIHA